MSNLINYIKQGHHPYLEDSKGRLINFEYNDKKDIVIVTFYKEVTSVKMKIDDPGLPIWIQNWLEVNGANDGGVDWID